MKLLLHAGTEKTGSSHIQTVCVNGREHLEHSGIWFPEGIARHERRMRAGQVSAGNAFAISDLVRENNRAGILAELVRHRKAAQSRSCRIVFLTSELLLPYCAHQEAWRGLFESCRQAGFTKASTLVILRDPVDQLISLYKHRARSGTAGRFDEWVDAGYHLPDDLARLREQATASDVELIARGYTREPGGLERIFFDDWLGIPAPPIVHKSEVNPSLSLSELELIHQVNEHRPALVPFIHERLTALPRERKVQGSALEDYARTLAAGEAWRNRKEWQAWNQLMPKGEQLIIPAQAPEIPGLPEELGFTIRQIEELSAFMAETARFPFLVRLFWRSRLRPFLGRIKRLVAL